MIIKVEKNGKEVQEGGSLRPLLYAISQLD